MSIRGVVGVLVATLMMISCTPVSAPAQEPGVEISLQRTACYGFCPVYRVTIRGDGTVHYVGERFVNVVGERSGAIPRAEVDRLLRRFDDIGFAALREEYRGQMTDLPTTIVTLTRNGQSKRVVDYGGVSAGMPRAMRALEDEIDRVANTAQWVLRDGQPVQPAPEY